MTDTTRNIRAMIHSRASLLVFAILFGFIMGRFVVAQEWIVSDSDCNVEYTLINPYLRCEPVEQLQKQEYVAFKLGLQEYINDKLAKDRAKDISVYFRDLENGPWFGIHEDEQFSPASLLKLPMLVAYFRKADFAPSILEQEIEVKGEAANDQGLPPEERLQSGNTYTIDELIRRMIVYSDNNALAILSSFLGQYSPEDDVFADTLASMGLASSETNMKDFLTVKRYSAFYRALYNASFLSKERSQKALELLAQTTFNEGIEARIPKAIPVSHKFGIRRNGQIIQLHDCGIVFHPKTHYIVCIMTKGQNQESLTSIIREISSMIYTEVDRRM